MQGSKQKEGKSHSGKLKGVASTKSDDQIKDVTHDDFVFNVNKHVGVERVFQVGFHKIFKSPVNFRSSLELLPFANDPLEGSQYYLNRSQKKFLALHRLITLDFLPFSRYPNEGSNYYRNRAFHKFLALHRIITLDFLPYAGYPNEGRQFSRNKPCRLQGMANKNVKSSRTFENLPDSFVKLPPAELLEEIYQVATGNMRPDWHQYLVATSGSSPDVDIMNIAEGRTYTIEEIDRVKRLFHEPSGITNNDIEEVLKIEEGVVPREDVPQVELGELSDRSFEYEEQLVANQHVEYFIPDDFEDVVKTEMILQVKDKLNFRFGVATLDTGANLNLLDISSLVKIGGSMDDVDTSVSALIRNSSTELGKEVLGVVSMKLHVVDKEAKQVIHLGAHEFFVINTGMDDVLIGTKSLKKILIHLNIFTFIQRSISWYFFLLQTSPQAKCLKLSIL